MVRELMCECDERYAATIDSFKLFIEVKDFFEDQAEKGIYEDIPVETPYFTGQSVLQTINWSADKWYRCKACGCLWEFTYPDFPALGFVRKFPDGKYTERGY